MRIKQIIQIANVPEYAYQYRYITYRLIDGEAWFWGAYEDSNEALDAAREIGGYVLDRVFEQ